MRGSAPNAPLRNRTAGPVPPEWTDLTLFPLHSNGNSAKRFLLQYFFDTLIPLSTVLPAERGMFATPHQTAVSLSCAMSSLTASTPTSMAAAVSWDSL